MTQPAASVASQTVDISGASTAMQSGGMPRWGQDLPNATLPVNPDAAQAHRDRWLAWYWQHRRNPLSSSRRARAGKRNAEAGRTAAGAVRVGGFK